MKTSMSNKHAVGERVNVGFCQALKNFKWKWFLTATVYIATAMTCTVIVFLSPLCSIGLYNNVLFNPFKYPAGAYGQPALRGITPSDHYFPSADGKKLHAWFYQVPGAKHVVLFSHGMGANISYGRRFYDIFMAEGNSVFAYDYEGYGRSEGQPSMEGICEDGHAAYHYLVDHLKVSPDKLLLFGESLGTVVTGDIANTEKAAAVILQCPLYSVLSRGRELIPWLAIYPDWMWPKKGLNNGRIFGKQHAPLLMIAGTKDHSTTVGQADMLFACASEPKTYIRIPGAGHSDPVMTNSPMYTAGLQAFFLSH